MRFMYVNEKKPLVFKNRTNYFDPAISKVKVRVSSPHSYQSRQQKIEGFESRLYWQFRFCEDNNGQTFYYTLTYNDNHIPNKYGFNCFDYEDLRDLLTGGFRKQLLRKYGTTFKYFVGAELGDGKGQRGMHNNPHYHILFFLENANDHRFPYRLISPELFRTLVKTYWQGFDENIVGYRSYKDAKYGIAKEGDYCGKVKDFRAISYVAKYVCKDVKLKRNETYVENFIRFRLLSSYKYSESSYRDYFYSRIYDMFNIPLNPSKTEWTFTPVELLKRLDSPVYGSYRIFEDNFNCLEVYWPFVMRIINKFGLTEDYFRFCVEHCKPLVDDALKEYRNRYCNKARISHGVGSYALQTIDKFNPSIQVPSKNGFKNRPIPLYYYRKLYCDTVKDSRSGNSLYLLNEDGINYKLSKLSSRIEKKAQDAETLYFSVINDRNLFEKMRNSDVNTDVYFHHSSFVQRMNELLKNESLKSILLKYGQYKMVYEDRFFSYRNSGLDVASDVLPIDVCGDYKRFLVPSFYSVSRNDLMLDLFLEDGCKDYLPYFSHPYFSKYIGVFNVLDLCADYFFIQSDNKRQEDAERIAEIRRFHNGLKLKEFYSHFS